MPPAESHKRLTAAQIALLKRWIDGGAPWKEHWAFQSPVKPTPPAVRDAAWVRNPIDRFILARLEEKGLAPAPAENRRALIRRVALDTTGLPPKPAEIEAFLQDSAANAYERMVDRYLASPHYGEHRARYWLDAARYGDTHGIHVDNYREIWPQVAIGSSRPTIAIFRSTSSRSNSWPAICCSNRRWSSASPPAFNDAT